MIKIPKEDVIIQVILKLVEEGIKKLIDKFKKRGDKKNENSKFNTQ
jgi:hypothetical protein